MQKITPKYLLWKIIICFLTQLMAAGLGIPFVMIAKANDLNGQTVATVLSVGVFIVYLFLHYGIMKRSNLSSISKRAYLIGETVSFSIIALVGAIALLILSRGLVPAGFSYFTAVFFCTYACSYLTGNIPLGIALQILLFTLCLTLLYAIKKKKDPCLKGNKQPLPKGAAVVYHQEEEGFEEKDEQAENELADKKEAGNDGDTAKEEP
ncbi:MAG: hypothetical protein J6M12_00185 [Clostridia bacterium]|nr:hypothetical protein [Clostridia bacterium]